MDNHNNHDNHDKKQNAKQRALEKNEINTATGQNDTVSELEPKNKGIKKMIITNATEARKDWSITIDSVIRDKPRVIKRTHDYLMLLNIDVLENILSSYAFHAEKFTEDDGSITLSLDEIDLVENGKDENQAKELLAKSILGYAEDYYDEFQYWSSDPARKTHIPYVLKALILNDASKIKESIQCRLGSS